MGIKKCKVLSVLKYITLIVFYSIYTNISFCNHYYTLSFFWLSVCGVCEVNFSPTLPPFSVLTTETWRLAKMQKINISKSQSSGLQPPKKSRRTVTAPFSKINLTPPPPTLFLYPELDPFLSVPPISMRSICQCHWAIAYLQANLTNAAN